MQAHRLSTLACLFGLLIVSLVSAASARQPNVLVIYADDQGSVDAPGFGAQDIELPSLRRLANEGVRLTQCYAPAPVCSPSRAGLLTGRYPLQAGVPGNVSSTPGDEGMPAEEVTMAEVFKEAGYATGHFGKWHLGFTPETMPNAQGFDFSFGHMGGCIDNYSHFFYWNGPNRHDLYRNGEEVRMDGAYFPDLLAGEVEQFIEKNRERPFFAYVALNLPHYPYQGDSVWLQYYREKGLPYPRDLYAAFLSTMDQRIGRMLDALERHDLSRDTIVLFQADNGHSVEERAHGGGGSAGAYRGAKFSLFEGGIRVPAIIRWPGELAAGAVRDQPVHGCDWLPTLAAMCRVPLPDVALDGVDLDRVLHDKDAPDPHERMIWHLGKGDTGQWAVRRGPWKLMHKNVDPTLPPGSPPVDQFFLSNLDEDHRESRNLAGEHPGIVEELRALHEEWLAGVERGGSAQ
ncbi:MAG: hypothetical protein RLZZ303_278 [Candidatus Hydrogenedentota bacterium]|jgi:arylsulfatase A-like enzyme